MPYSATLEDYQPSPRYGTATPWTEVRFEQAVARSGPFTQIDAQPLVPSYTDPENPPAYDLTTELMTTYPGWLRIVFRDADGTEELTEPVFVGSAIRPTVAEVANLMPDRATTAAGGSGGTFTTGTEPTATQVDSLIDQVLDTIEPLVPGDAGGETLRSARAVVALHTAILVEVGHFGDQTDINEARIAVWQSLIERHTLVLDAAARDNVPGGVRAYGVPITTPMASAFPASELLP